MAAAFLPLGLAQSVDDCAECSERAVNRARLLEGLASGARLGDALRPGKIDQVQLAPDLA